jgi:phosphoglucosamine mutase
MSLRFGTDGVRGRAYSELTLDAVRRLAAVAGTVLGSDRVYIARDTRASGPDFERALAQGFADAGVRASSLGVAPTPAAAWLSAADGVAAAVISASHNPYVDNGVKLFAPGGCKLSDAVQDRIQAGLDAAVGDLTSVDEPALADARGELDRWEAALVASLDGRRLDGLSLVIDCANGAAAELGPRVLRALGARVEVLHAAPDGRNINEACGSTHPDDLRRRVVESGADVGLAFDGDADRVLAVDHTGELVDGDQIIAVCALDRHERGALAKDTVAVTVMTNLGFRLAMQRHGIAVVETAVGDRHVLEALERTGAALGGEQSGHVIFRDLATTGDGLLTGIQLLDVICRRGVSLAELASRAMRRLPQVLHNVRVASPVADLDGRIAADVEAVTAALGAEGRVLIRRSGTEPLVRVMVEAPSLAQAEAAAERLVAAVRRATSSGA